VRFSISYHALNSDTLDETKMIAYKSSSCYVGHAPAKLNLFFEIHGKRADGFHNVTSLCCLVSVFDTLLFEPRQQTDIAFTCTSMCPTQKSHNIPSGADNLVVKAIELVRKQYGIENGCHLKLIKRIPNQAGMGGASSDAAMAIRLANRAWDLRLSQHEMITLGAELGSDVPLFFIKGMSIGHGRGELVEPLGTIPRLDFVIIKPSEGISTAEAFRMCCADQITDYRSPERLLQGLHSGNRREIAAGMFNRLEATAWRLCPKIRRIRTCFDELDCPVHQMTGSGTAYFALCRNFRQARCLATRLRLAGIGDVYVAHSVQ